MAAQVENERKSKTATTIRERRSRAKQAKLGQNANWFRLFFSPSLSHLALSGACSSQQQLIFFVLLVIFFAVVVWWRWENRYGWCFGWCLTSFSPMAHRPSRGGPLLVRAGETDPIKLHRCCCWWFSLGRVRV